MLNLNKTVFNPHFFVNVLNYFILTGGMLISIQMRLEIPIGKTLGDDYNPYPNVLYVLLFLATLVTYGLAWLCAQNPTTAVILAPLRQFRILMFSLFLTCTGIILFQPNVSLLQLTYLVIIVVILGLMVIVLPTRMRRSAYIPTTLNQEMQALYKSRFLISIWLKYRIQVRYSQTALGIMWIVLLPLSQSLVLAFAFTQLLGINSGAVPFVVFILSGQVLFAIFNTVISNSTHLLVGSMSVMRQVYFPREVLIIVTAFEAMIDFFFMFIAFILICAVYDIYPNIYYLYVPLLLVNIFILTLGLGFIVSWLSLAIRDFQQLVGILVQLLSYITVFYNSSRVIAKYTFLPLVNPLSAITEAFRAIVLYDKPPDFVTLYSSLVISVAILYLGYVYFKANEDKFLDYI